VVLTNGSNGFCWNDARNDFQKSFRAGEEGPGAGRFAEIGNTFTQIGMLLTRNRFCDYFCGVNLKQFIQRDVFLTSNAARLTRVQHLAALWTCSAATAVMPLQQFIEFDSFLALNAADWSRERRLEELWVFLQIPPRSAAPNPRAHRPVADPAPERYRLRLVGGWEN